MLIFPCSAARLQQLFLFRHTQSLLLPFKSDFFCGYVVEQEREKKRLEKCRTNEWAERRMVSREGGLQCGVARQAEEEEADCRAGVALHRRGPLIKSEGQTWELTQASAAASQRRRRGGSLTTPPSPSGRPACWPQRGMGGGQGAGSSSGSLCRLLNVALRSDQRLLIGV